MIQFLADNIDQLDLALDQLSVGDRNFDRFALMLIDNVVELTLHQVARDRAAENRLWTSLNEPKLDPKLIENALGQRFDTKVKLATVTGTIDGQMQTSLLRLHAFRNTAYHQGRRHETILHSLTLFYFRCACRILSNYRPRYWSWASSDTYSHRARKYLGEPSFGDPEQLFVSAYHRLSEVASSMEADLVGDLAADMSATIDDMDNAIEFLATDSPEQLTRDDVIVDSQAWGFAFTDDARTFARNGGCREKTVGGYVRWLAEHYSWPFRNDPIPGWRQRLDRLRNEDNEDLALQRYSDFMRQTEGLRDALEKSAAQLDQQIQEQIERARGK